MFGNTGRRLLALGAAAIMGGCSGNTLGTLGDVLGAATGQPAGSSQGTLSVEIRSVDTQRQTLQVATQDGQTGNVRYDERTVVVYQNQQFPVSALERGDIAVLTVQDMQGTLYVSRVEVQQSVQERSGAGTGTGNIVQLTGRVAQINQTNGTFVLQTSSGNVTATLPYNPPQATLDYFRRLRNGDSVRLEAVPLSNVRVEIYRFL